MVFPDKFRTARTVDLIQKGFENAANDVNARLFLGRVARPAFVGKAGDRC